MSKTGSCERSLNDFDLHEVIYKGRASQVCVASVKSSGREVALKMYRKKKLTSLERMRVDREIRIHMMLAPHPGIVKLLSSFEDDERIYMEMELLPGDLFKTLIERGQLDEEGAVLDVLIPLIEALMYLHEQGIIHRDLKPENILLTENGQVKLADFGLVIDMSEERPVSRLGTLDYMAPEVLLCPANNQPENKEQEWLWYNDKVDSWAVGILTYELLIGCAPFDDESREKVCMSILEEEPSYPSSLSKGAKSFIRAALIKDAALRPSSRELLDHPWTQAWSQWVKNPSASVRPDSKAFVFLDEFSPSGSFQQQQQNVPSSSTPFSTSKSRPLSKESNRESLKIAEMNNDQALGRKSMSAGSACRSAVGSSKHTLLSSMPLSDEYRTFERPGQHVGGSILDRPEARPGGRGSSSIGQPLSSGPASGMLPSTSGGLMRAISSSSNSGKSSSSSLPRQPPPVDVGEVGTPKASLIEKTERHQKGVQLPLIGRKS